MTAARLVLTRDQILAYRRQVRRSTSASRPGWTRFAEPRGPVSRTACRGRRSIRSTPASRAPDGTMWEHPSLVQVWGAAVQRVRDLGRGPCGVHARAPLGCPRPSTARGDDHGPPRGVPRGSCPRVRRGRPRDGHPTECAALRGADRTVLICWDGAAGRPCGWFRRQRTIRATLGWSSPAGSSTSSARRPSLRSSIGPGIRPPGGRAPFDALAAERSPSRLRSETPGFSRPTSCRSPRRRIGRCGPAPPSGDTYTLHQGADRELLVPGAAHVACLEHSVGRCRPAGGEIVGTWRRADTQVTIGAVAWLSSSERVAIEDEGDDLPAPGRHQAIVRWVAATMAHRE